MRELTPDTSYGFAVIQFARDVLGTPLDPWQEWLVIHAGELLPDDPNPLKCRPRFRQVLVLVARQNGKTFLCRVLTLFWLFVEAHRTILGTSSMYSYAKASWEAVVDAAEAVPELKELIPRGGARRANGEVRLKTVERAVYAIAAANRKGGRSMSIDRAIADELREQQTMDSYDAVYNAMRARRKAQWWAITNAGDDRSVVLNMLQKKFSRDVAKGKRAGIFEWSAVNDCDVLDQAGWCAANPNLGYRLDANDVAEQAELAKESGGKVESGFRTESLCQHVRALDAAVDPTAWGESVSAFDLGTAKGRVAACLDISPDGLHATLCAASSVSPGVYGIKVVAAWSGIGCSEQLRRDLPSWLERVKPRQLGWFPSGPAAAFSADMTKEKGWPRGMMVEQIKADITATCMALNEQVIAKRVVHPDDALLNMHVLSAEKLGTGDMWKFSRRGGGHCDAAYAAAGALQLARTMPPPLSTKSVASSAVKEERAKNRGN